VAWVRSSWLRRTGAGWVLNPRGPAATEIQLPYPGGSREWLEAALVECHRCHQVVARTSAVHRHCVESLGRCRASILARHSRMAEARRKVPATLSCAKMPHPTLSHSTASTAHRLRFLLLALVGLFLGHTAVFAAQYGVGGNFAAAMTAGGHDDYWGVFMLIASTGGLILLIATIVRISRLPNPAPVRALVRLPDIVTGGDLPTYGHVFVDLARRLMPTLIVGYAIQENIEHLASHGHLIGLGALGGTENPIALPVLVAVSAALAALGALVRWRIALLVAHRAAAPHSVRERGHAPCIPALAWVIRPAVPSAILLPLLGRAPPA